jgi:hypothetical protein
MPILILVLPLAALLIVVLTWTSRREREARKVAREASKIALAVKVADAPLTQVINDGRLECDEAQTKGEITEAMHWYRKAANGDAFAQYSIGLLYRNGTGVAQDYAEAMRGHRVAADQGFAQAQSDIGVMYQSGLGVPQDHAEAGRWYRKAAEQGDANAQHCLGKLHQHGWGVQQDHAAALYWYRAAADQGNTEAQIDLGVMCGSGLCLLDGASGDVGNRVQCFAFVHCWWCPLSLLGELRKAPAGAPSVDRPRT